MKPLLCIDFDGTITPDCKTVFPGCIATLTRLRETYSIGIFSARATQAERDQMVRLLDEWGVPYNLILPPKPNAVAFIDDRGYKFDGDWEKVPSSF
jgi:hypothetical protein